MHRPESCLCHGHSIAGMIERCAWLGSRRIFFTAVAPCSACVQTYHENELSTGQPDRFRQCGFTETSIFYVLRSGRSGIAVFTGTKYAHCIKWKDREQASDYFQKRVGKFGRIAHHLVILSQMSRHSDAGAGVVSIWSNVQLSGGGKLDLLYQFLCQFLRKMNTEIRIIAEKVILQ